MSGRPEIDPDPGPPSGTPVYYIPLQPAPESVSRESRSDCVDCMSGGLSALVLSARGGRRAGAGRSRSFPIVRGKLRNVANRSLSVRGRSGIFVRL